MGGCVILAVFVVRGLLQRAPKIFSYGIWSVAAFRLICPVSLASWFSIFNLSPFGQGEAVSDSGIVTHIPQNMVAGGAAEAVRAAGEIVKAGSGNSTASMSVGSNISLGQTGAGVWAAGILILLCYGGLSYGRMRKKVERAVLLRDNIYECDEISSPFVMGVISPRIYVPFRLPKRQLEMILLHEQYHIKRRDYLVKLGAFLLLAVYWFHPLVWAAYYCMGKDMEMSCDEWVIQRLGEDGKKEYSMALLGFASGRRLSVLQPLSFGESGTRGRIKNVLRCKKLGIGAMAGAGVICGALLIICGTNGIGDKNYIQFQSRQAAVLDFFPAESSSFTYRVEKKVQSYAIYTEVYHKGSLYEREIRDYGKVGKEGIPSKGTGTAGFWVEERDGGGYYAAHLNLQFGQEDTSVDIMSQLPDNIGNGMSLSVLDATKENGNKFRKVAVQPEQDVILVAANVSEGKLLAYSCAEYMENPGRAGENDITILYRMVFSEKKPEELKESLSVSRQARELYEGKHPYVGDASANGKLLDILSKNGYLPKAAYTTELETSDRPYVLRLVFQQELPDNNQEDRRMMLASALLLALTDNLDEVQWQYPIEGAKEIKQMTKYWDGDSISYLVEGGEIKKYGESAGKVQELLELAE